MHATTPAPRRVARAIAAALWAVGSAYLIKTELSSPEPDWVVITATPIVWLTVIALPILSHHALKDRQWLAAALLALAALVGSAYTLTGTLARSSEARDARVAKAEAQSTERRRIVDLRAEATDMLDDANRKLDKDCVNGRRGKGHCDGIRATIAVYTAALAGHDAALSKLKIESPAAGERRVAAALSALPWADGSADDYAEAVGLWMPALLGLVLEIGALAAAMYGWHAFPSRRDSFQSSFAGSADPAMFSGPQPPVSGPQGSGPKGGKRCRQPLPANVADLASARMRRQTTDDLQRQALLDALAIGPANNTILAARMGVHASEATRRRQAFSDLIDEQIIGREVRIALRS